MEIAWFCYLSVWCRTFLLCCFDTSGWVTEVEWICPLRPASQILTLVHCLKTHRTWSKSGKLVNQKPNGSVAAVAVQCQFLHWTLYWTDYSGCDLIAKERGQTQFLDFWDVTRGWSWCFSLLTLNGSELSVSQSALMDEMLCDGGTQSRYSTYGLNVCVASNAV